MYNFIFYLIIIIFFIIIKIIIILIKNEIVITLYNPFPNYPFTGTLRPVYPLSPKREIPAHIEVPDYAESGILNFFKKLNN